MYVPSLHRPVVPAGWPPAGAVVAGAGALVAAVVTGALVVATVTVVAGTVDVVTPIVVTVAGDFDGELLPQPATASATTQTTITSRFTWTPPVNQETAGSLTDVRHGYIWVALIPLVGCAPTVKDTFSPTTETSEAVTTSTSAVPPSAVTVAHPGLVPNAMPDPKLTPGATDPRVTQADIASTICVAGYTKTVRPPSRYTSTLKRGQMADRGLPGVPADYEEDHLIALELGGDPADERNLWPEPLKGEGGALQKDRLENLLHRQVCAGTIQLDVAQREMATDWYGTWLAAGRP